MFFWNGKLVIFKLNTSAGGWFASWWVPVTLQLLGQLLRFLALRIHFPVRSVAPSPHCSVKTLPMMCWFKYTSSAAKTEELFPIVPLCQEECLYHLCIQFMVWVFKMAVGIGETAKCAVSFLFSLAPQSWGRQFKFGIVGQKSHNKLWGSWSGLREH